MIGKAKWLVFLITTGVLWLPSSARAIAPTNPPKYRKSNKPEIGDEVCEQQTISGAARLR